MLVNQGEDAFGEGEKAKNTVKATNTSMKAYAKATVLLVLRMVKRLLRSVTRFPPPMGTYFVASAMEIEAWAVLSLFLCKKNTEVNVKGERERERERERLDSETHSENEVVVL